MWEPQHLTTLWASKACYKDTFTFFTFNHRDYLLWRIDPLVGKDLETDNDTTAASMQRRGKYASVTMEFLLEKVFSNPSVQRGYKEGN
jgi:hypothetical protein